jgi:hypothetical protein
MSLNRYSDDDEKYSYRSFLSRNNSDVRGSYQGTDKNDQEDNEEFDLSPSASQRHVHEVQGSVEIAEPQEDPHNHRFATVTGEAIPIGNGDHIHEVKFRTDFYENHFHEFCGKTGGAIRVGDRHVHFLESETTRNDGHRHDFRLSTFIDNPIGD